MSWRDILTYWDLIEADLQQVYGLDVEDLTLMRGRTWRWLRVRIFGLLSLPPTITPVPDAEPLVVARTRLGFALDPSGME